MNILNIHGYRGNRENSVFAALSNFQVKIISPQIDYDRQRPHEILALLHDLWQEHDCQVLAGSSLGGFYAALLSVELQARALLINPCMLPFLHLPQIVEEQKSILLDYMSLFGSLTKINKNNVFAVIGEQDEVINTHSFSQNLLGREQCIFVPEGKHSGWTLPLADILQENWEKFWGSL